MTYRGIPFCLEGREPFQGNSMSAHWNDDSDPTYIVLSYGTVIATANSDGVVIIPENRWGPTTGRHINLCRRHLR